MFEDGVLRERLEAQSKLIIDLANRLSDGTLLSKPAEELARELVERFELQAPELLVERMEVEEAGSGKPFELLVPFSGNAELFRYQPNHFQQSHRPEGEVVNDEVVITLGLAPDLGADAALRAKQLLAPLQEHLGWVAHELGAWRYQFEDELRGLIRRRIEIAETHRDAVTNLGIRCDAVEMLQAHS
jgi:hypothetical protein